MPILLAVGGSNAIQMLRIDSNTVSVWDKAFQLAVTSLRHNSTLRTLSLAHWTFDLQEFPQLNPAGPVVVTHAPYHTRRLLCHHLLHSALNAPQESA
ncbi:hypothetical protein Pcinc_037754 [Petrolisthes cinctipes]|uniref:Uncharacterized protein n=1 Tax=Petrolisthes cinctipes TaxID=88211 RepID=A0AAE1ENN2_PETCI|nr:hypothetical protein Pcinc_037754 [Petrolisthes cinctipes]